MDTTQALRRELRRPDWPAAAVAGFAAGAILMVLDLLWSVLVVGASPWANSHRIAALVMGPPAHNATEFDAAIVAISLVVHYALGIASGLVFALVSAPLRLDATPAVAALAGVVFGLVIYLVNFHGVVRFFPWLADIRGWATLTGHLVFGASAALLYWKLGHRGEVPNALREARSS